MNSAGMRTLYFLMFTVVLLLSGCGSQPPTPEGAAAVARQFLEAWGRGDPGAMDRMLTEAAQVATPDGAITRHIRQQKVTFDSLGAPVTADGALIQVPVQNLRITTANTTARWPEYRLTLQHDGRRWRVAWVDPLSEAAQQAYDNSRFGDQLDLARAISTIDPFHYRGPLELHYAYKGLKRFREAELALLRARELATPAQAPAVEDAFARFKVNMGVPADAVPLARAALDKAAPYMPDLYPPRWQADTLVVLARGLAGAGDLTGARAAAQQAASIEPQNASLAMLLRELPPTP